MATIDTTTALIYLTIIVLANGFFVAAEFALVKVRSTQIELLAARGSLQARVTMSILNNLDGYLSACQLGVTLASLALGWIGEPVVASLIDRLLRLIGIDSPELAHQIALPTAFVSITFLHIVIGEQAPKMAAIQKATAVSLFSALPLRVFYALTYPFIKLLNSSSNFVVSLLGIRPVSEAEISHTTEELKLIVAQAEKSQELSLISKDLLINTLDLRRRVARQIMIPRTQVTFLSTRAALKECLEIARKTQHTRFPVGDPDLDNILGFVHIKDILWLLQDKGERADIRSVVRPVLFVPELVSLEKLLRSMQSRRTHAAIVVDEFGAVAGMVTLENIIEEIVGDIQDEFDSERPLWSQSKTNQWLFDGAMPIHELRDILGLDLTSRDATTLGGYLIELLGHFPREGEKLEVEGYDVTVKQVDRTRIRQIVIERKASVD